MKALIATLAAVALISTPLAASASHAGGGHAAGGFRGSGRGFGDHRGEHFHHDHFFDHGGDVFLFGAGFGLGLGFYDDLWPYGYFPADYPYDDAAGYDPGALPPAETGQCGNWHWDADIQKYRWVAEAC